jgi:DNA-binding transcriptional regulator YiaG
VPEDTNIIDLASKRQKRTQSLEETNESITRRAGRPPTHGAYRSDTIYPERIVMAREFMGFSQEDFAEVLSITLEEMQAWEEGTAQPTLEQLHTFAFVTGTFTVGWFCQPVDSSWPGMEQTTLRFH